MFHSPSSYLPAPKSPYFDLPFLVLTLALSADPPKLSENAEAPTVPSLQITRSLVIERLENRRRSSKASRAPQESLTCN
ncbi:hypothetical protein L596_015602 [Steinernema carpocapsae]|uniref:Uncharacterized protein n=1 Tax=Steinernema carpocapsae TaxID=34508 RepID=A0A4U5NGQ3_STECR|nr:hypothetical protein L596_015602 [Steinernema carpocapsae]